MRSAPSTSPADPAHLATLRAQLPGLIQRLEAGLLEREAAARLLLLAALAGEHVLLIGPPGTAKSELARRLHGAFDGARYFERLLTRFSTPEELFGPLSLKALEDDRYERLTDGYLPTAGIAFLDEVFKANSAILNALLTLLNEREFDNGAGRLRTPLISVVGASNEGPGDESLAAFHDRFLLRVPVAPVSDGAFAALLRLGEGCSPPPPTGSAPDEAASRGITADQRSALQAAASAVALGEPALAGLAALRAELARLGATVSDRRWRQLVALMRCAAASEGRAQIDPLDLWLVPYATATDSAQLAPLADWVQHTLLQAQAQPLDWLAHAVSAFEKQLDIEQRQPAQDGEGLDDSAGKLALARAIGLGEGEGDGNGSAGNSAGPRLRAAPLEDKLRRAFSPVHVHTRLAQVAVLAGRLAAVQAQVQQAHDALAGQLATRLWLPPAQGRGWLAAHQQTLATVAALQARLAAAQAGFAGLKVDAQLPATAPTPVAWADAPSA